MDQQLEKENYITETNSSLQQNISEPDDKKRHKTPISIKIAALLMILFGSFFSLAFWEKIWGDFWFPMFFITISYVFFSILLFFKKTWAWYASVVNILTWIICCLFTAFLDFYSSVYIPIKPIMSFWGFISSVGLIKFLSFFILFFILALINLIPLKLLFFGRKKYFERISQDAKELSKKKIVAFISIITIIFLGFIYWWAFYKSGGVNDPEFNKKVEDSLSVYKTLEQQKNILEKQKSIREDKVDLLIDKKNIVDTEEKKEELRKFAKMAGQQIEIIDGITFTNNDGGFEVSTSTYGHAFLERYDNTAVMHLDTKGIKEAVIQTHLEVPIEANFMRFSYNFLVTDDNGVLESFIKDVPAPRIFTKYYKNPNFNDYIDSSKTWAHSNWIPLESKDLIPPGFYKGQKVPLVFRLSNLKPDEKYHALLIDDIYFAKIGL